MPPLLWGLTPRQIQFLKDEHRFIVNASGRRSRKTLLSRRKVLIKACQTPYQRLFLAAPTYGQAKAIYWEELLNDTHYIRSSTRRPNATTLSVELKNGTQIFVIGLSEARRFEGQPWHGGMITECADLKPNVWSENIRPVLSDTNGFCYLDGVPEGRNWWYQLSLYARGGAIPHCEPITGAYAENIEDDEWAYYHWFSSDVLNAREIKMARMQLDERTFRQEYEGAFVSFAGTMYYTFAQNDNVADEKTEVRKNEPLYLTCDFNKSPMVWEVCQTAMIDGKLSLLFLDEMSVSYDAKTGALTHKFIEKYRNHTNKVLFLHGDAANRWDATTSYLTDYKIMIDMIREAGWDVKVNVSKSNPNINNRVGIFCSLLKSARGEIRIFINSKCKYLIKDLISVVGDSAGGKNKKADPTLTHASDAADYLVWDLYKREFGFGRSVQQL